MEQQVIETVDTDYDISAAENLELLDNTFELKVDRRQAAKILHQLKADGSYTKVIQAKRSEFAQALLYLNRKPFDLSQRGYLNHIYNCKFPKILLKTGRQVEKSSTIAAITMIDCLIQPFYACLYVSPTADQTRTFSNQKIRPFIEESPIVQRYFVNNKVESQVFNKAFTNGSRLLLRYAFLTADRVRGISASRLGLDEIQDILWDNVPVIRECLSHAQHPTEMYCGTPKTYENTIEKLWHQSSQCEWVVPCDGHIPPHYNVLGMENIGKLGPICSKCGKYIDTTKGFWSKMKEKDYEFMGFRINQLMVHWKQDTTRWQEDILAPMDGPNAWEPRVFYNEKLGLSYDYAARPITRQDIMDACDKTAGSKWALASSPDERVRGLSIFGGIDWGTGEETVTPTGKKKHSSYTILTLIAKTHTGRKWPLFIKKYEGKEIDPNFIIDDICQIDAFFGVKYWGMDWGFGWGINNILFRKLPQRCIQFQYVPMQAEKRKWDPSGYKFTLNRNMVMSEFFVKIKQGAYQFPPWEEFETWAEQILCIFTDYRSRVASKSAMYYDHPLDQPDDFTHSLIYGEQAYEVYNSIK